MPLAWFSKKKKDDEQDAGPDAAADGGDEGNGDEKLVAREAEEAEDAGGDKGKKKKERIDPLEAEKAARDPRKARKFFDYAKTVADSRNYDYAIECYINGLRHEPESLKRHEELYDVAARRKVAGGKAAGFKDKRNHSGGKTPTERMLNAEFMWAKDFTNAQLAINVVEAASEAGYEEVVYWVGEKALELAKAQKRPNKIQYLKLKDAFKEVAAYDLAVQACALALQMAPQDMVLLKELHDLETEKTIHKSGVGQEGTTVEQVTKDSDKQKALEQDDSLSLNEQQQAAQLERFRKAHEEKPDDVDLMSKYIRALVATDKPANEDQAMMLMESAFERFKQYRFKMQQGDLAIKQKKRTMRDLRAATAEAADETEKARLHEELKKAAHDLLQFELQEYTDRAKAYPTDMGIRFDLGVRQFAVGQNDPAIESFQKAQDDPKKRAWALRYLGECFARKEWFDAAVDTFHRGIEVHPYSDDRLALELQYELMKVYFRKAVSDKDVNVAEECRKLASKIAQIDFNYKDIREWVDKSRALVDKLRSDAA